MRIECAGLENEKKNFSKCLTAFYASLVYGSQIVTLWVACFLKEKWLFFVEDL